MHISPKEILQKTVEASGGDTWQQPKTLMLKGNATWTPYGKTDESKLFFDDYAMYRVFPTENDAAHKANGKVRFDAKYGENVFMHLIFDSKTTINYLSEEAKPYQKHFSWSNNFGFGIIRFANNEGYFLERLTDDQVEGNECYIIQITDPKKMVTTFSIDQKSFYIRSVAFTTDVGFHHRIYSDFEKKVLPSGAAAVAEDLGGAFIQPKRVRLYFEGIKWMDINWREFRVNEEIDEGVFKPTQTLPEGGLKENRSIQK